MVANTFDWRPSFRFDASRSELHYVTSGAGSKTRLEFGVCCNKANFFLAQSGEYRAANASAHSLVI